MTGLTRMPPPTVEAATLPESRLQRPALADKYAVIDVGGTQHLVEEGRWYTCNRLQVRRSFRRMMAPTM